MNLIIALTIMIGAVIASYYLAVEKGQQKFVWPIATTLIGPGVFIVQYLVVVFNQKRKMA